MIFKRILEYFIFILEGCEAPFQYPDTGIQIRFLQVYPEMPADYSSKRFPFPP